MPASLIACHECDLLQSPRPITERGTAFCGRCGAELYRQVPHANDRVIALSIAGLVLFAVANTLPFLAIEAGGREVQMSLFSGARQLWMQGMWALALLVAVTCIVAPFVQLVLMLHIFLPLKLGLRPWRAPLVLRYLRAVQPWSMMEVFMLGILVAMVKLVQIASVLPGVALGSFLLLIIVLAAAISAMNLHQVWAQLET